MSSVRTLKWLREHRFDLDTAIKLAGTVSLTRTVDGLTGADILARLQET
ncbi:hypothetical protein [Nocardia transvalensis]|nr:hypothetical protein [Nocardia transvalensis]MBF6332444.1 hypothetical protein [Nocardia transvalensis]